MFVFLLNLHLNVENEWTVEGWTFISVYTHDIRVSRLHLSSILVASCFCCFVFSVPVPSLYTIGLRGWLRLTGSRCNVGVWSSEYDV